MDCFTRDPTPARKVGDGYKTSRARKSRVSAPLCAGFLVLSVCSYVTYCASRLRRKMKKDQNDNPLAILFEVHLSLGP